MELTMDQAGVVATNIIGQDTVTAQECEVTNGFVKNGTSLPYIIETSNSAGNKKRSSKILPVCGICGKKFVCVTTMKRHLVTHTGERPFNCKVCGKQYTQKGNLRVHERTHRNDRPFECNICHQKFYRKEPMQKHQWRQHGIGHYKSRPPGPDGSSSIGIIGAESVLYNTLTRVAVDHEEGVSRDHSPHVLFEPHLDVPEAVSHTEVTTIGQSFSEDEEEDVTGQSVSAAVTRYINDTPDNNADIANNDHDDPRRSLEILKLNTHTDQPRLNDITENAIEEARDDSQDVNKPMKLKMKLAQAYLKEVEEEREREERDVKSREGRDNYETLSHIEENLGDIQLTKTGGQVAAKEAKEKECVECVCKACGSKCSVSDPYNFSCQHCNVKYTSLPTHMIADPLQCIGCMMVFQHKPAMKEHQSSKDKERPFMCCKCGYEFKQKAHLQKHQWRIHRRKLEPDPNVKEAEAILKAVNDLPSDPPTPRPTQVFLEQEVKRETVLSLEHLEGSKPLDLSPCKMYGSANSITQWVQQVETARTPIIPDITILKKPINPEEIKAKLPTEPLKLSQLTQMPQEKVSVTIQLLEPPKIGPTWHRNGNINQPFAVKSKPSDSIPLNSWRSLANTRDENPLLNQKTNVTDDILSRPPPVIFIDNNDRLYKRPRTEQEQSHPADLSITQKLDFSPPSPPLNLSSKDRVEDVPFDYTISRSELITGQLRRLRNQDERSGI